MCWEPSLFKSYVLTLVNSALMQSKIIGNDLLTVQVVRPSEKKKKLLQSSNYKNIDFVLLKLGEQGHPNTAIPKTKNATAYQE